MSAATDLLPASPPPDETGGPGDRLALRIRALGTRSLLQRSDRWMLVVGGSLVPLGVLLIVLGWLGAAHTPLIFEQIPYTISGGQLGLALVVIGGLVYFTYWQAVRVREARAQHAELIAVLERLDARLAGGGATTSKRRSARSTT